MKGRTKMVSNDKKLIAVIGATGQQGGGVLRALQAAFEGAHGVFLVTNFQEAGSDELKQATAAISAAKDAGVKHFIWSTLPDVEAISGGKFNVPHFTGKAKIDRVV